jgi:hypothetical protein
VTVCTATGSADVRTLAELWNGLRWSVQPTSSLDTSDGLDTELDGVSCVSASDCIAVGWAHNASALAGQWDGVSWSPQPTPAPGGAGKSDLLDVSCPTTTACVAVGDTGPSEHQVTLGESWDGVSWTILKTPNPGGGSLYELDQVSCVSSTDCFAVGYYSPSPQGGATVPLAARWDGTRWTVQKTPVPDKATTPSSSGSPACLSGRVSRSAPTFTVAPMD